ncbi:hypothetical protein PQ459_12595 [Chryseobacterium sp. KACC 21268]|nr:hypothetical protein PQ459_12595 [Chryseobacterium sp. KACC 21268]
MKNVLILSLLILNGLAFGQQKKTKKAPPIVKQNLPEPPKAKDYETIISEDSKKCFVYKVEEKKDSLVYVTENLLEYGWAGSNARLIITTYNYDASKKNPKYKSGDIYAPSQRLRYIDGHYKIEKNTLNFTPDKAENYQNRTFKLVYKPKTQNVESLKDENNHPFKKGDCSQPTISL